MASISFDHAHDHAVVLFVGELDWEASHQLVSTIETVADHYFYTELELLIASPGAIPGIPLLPQRLPGLAKTRHPIPHPRHLHRRKRRRRHGLGDIRELVFSAPDLRQPFGGQDHVRADDQGGDTAVQLRDGHPVPFDGNGVQQVLQPVEIRVRVAHGPAVIRTALRGSTAILAVDGCEKPRVFGEIDP